MRLLTIHPGADWSTADLYNGLVPALEAEGVQCIPYALNRRIDVAAAWLNAAYEATDKSGPRPNDADVVYKASTDAIERALRLDVDWVLVFSAMYFHPDAMILLRKAGKRIAVILTESPYEDEAEKKVLQWADVAWTNERSCVEDYRQVNPHVHYLPHAYDPVRHQPGWQPGDADMPSWDVVFVGTPFPERIATLEAIDWSGIRLGLYGFWEESLDANSPLRTYVRGGVTPNDKTAALYRQAKIGLNLYRKSRHFDGSGGLVENAESLNPRALELAACGVFQISDRRAEVTETFGLSVPTFETPTELESLILRYVQSPGSRFILADTSRKCLTNQTFADRAQQIIGTLDAYSQPTLVSVKGALV